MSEKQVWFITGAGRGMGVDFAKAALAAGHQVVATGRTPDTVRAAIGDADDLLVARLDVTVPAEAEMAVNTAVDRFGRIDVLVNNAANFYGGYFEERGVDPERLDLGSERLHPALQAELRRSVGRRVLAAGEPGDR